MSAYSIAREHLDVVASLAADNGVDLEAVRAAVERFVARDEFIAWLPVSYEMQIEAAAMNAERRLRASRLIDLLQERHALGRE